MSIRPIDNSLIVPQSVNLAREAASMADKGHVAQQFSVHLTDKQSEQQFRVTNEVLESKITDALDGNAQGGAQQEEHHGKRKGEGEEQEEFSLTSTTIDIRI